MQIIVPTAADVSLLGQLMRATFTETFGHLYPPADLAAYLDTAYAPTQLVAEMPIRATSGSWFWMKRARPSPISNASQPICRMPTSIPTDTARSSASTCSGASRAGAWGEG